jgi:hypothetical protein
MSIEANYNASIIDALQKNPNYQAMLNDLTTLIQESKLRGEDLNPPNPTQLKADLAAMLKLANQLNIDAKGDLSITPTIGLTIDGIENAETLLNAGDFTGIEEVIIDPASNFQQSLFNIRNFILYPGTPSQPVAPDAQGVLNQLTLLQGYLAEFKSDLNEVPPNLNDADRIYGYVLTAANNIFQDAPYDPSISPIAAELIGTIDNIRALFLLSPPDIQGCLALLNDGSLQQQMSQISSYILAI